MTKINEIMSAGAAQKTAVQKKTQEREQGSSFQDVLKNLASAEEGRPELSSQTVNLAKGLEALQEAQASGNVDPILNPRQISGIAQAERTLEVLGQYQSLLGDGKFSLKDMAGTVQALEQETKELTKLLEGLDPEDQLYGILEGVASVATVESIKFNRGDFIPQATV